MCRDTITADRNATSGAVGDGSAECATRTRAVPGGSCRLPLQDARSSAAANRWRGRGSGTPVVLGRSPRGLPLNSLTEVTRFSVAVCQDESQPTDDLAAPRGNERAENRTEGPAGRPFPLPQGRRPPPADRSARRPNDLRAERMDHGRSRLLLPGHNPTADQAGTLPEAVLQCSARGGIPSPPRRRRSPKRGSPGLPPPPRCRPRGGRTG